MSKEEESTKPSVVELDEQGEGSTLRRRSNAATPTDEPPPKRKIRLQFELKVTPAG